MAQKMANKRAAGGAAARAAAPAAGAILPGRRGTRAAAAASSDASSKAAQTAAYIETMPGISGPFDSPFFDPLGLHKGASIPDVRRWRELGQGFWEPLLLAIGICE